MDIGKEMKTKLINYMLSKGIDMINEKGDVRSVIKEEMHGEDRTVLLKIKEFDTLGFGIKGEELVKLKEADIPNPTVTVLVSEDCFIQIVRGKLTFRDAFFYADMDISGDNWMRDYVVFNKIFEQFNILAKELGI